MTDNLNKADEELRDEIKFHVIAEHGLCDPSLLDFIMQAIKQRDAIRDKALGDYLIGNNENSEGNKPHGDVRNHLRQEQRQRLARYLKGENTKYQLPGFENTMSDLDKLTVKPANEEEEA